MVYDNNLMPSFLDRQISTADRDAFGHRHYAHALQSLIELSDHAPPFSIGLLGGWGTGKSTIKEIYISNLQDDARKDDSGLTRSARIHCITFNAWRFGGKEQDIKRALLRHVFLELGGDEENLQDRLFRQISESHEESKSFWRRMLDIFLGWLLPLPVFILSLLILLGLLLAAHYLIPVDNAQAKSIIVLALSWSYAYLFNLIKSPPDTGNRSVTRISLPTTTAEQYEDMFIDQIAQFKSGKSKTSAGRIGKTCERLAVFVDDLDRLSAEEMVLGLDAVRTFMEIPEARLPAGLGLVFVISCDEAKVAQALAERRRQGDMPGTVFNQPDARRYLDRIFQFRLEIPPFPRQDMRQYAIERLNELPVIKSDFKNRGLSIEALVDRMIHVGVNDPRNAIQIINAFAQAWWIAKKREIEELGTQRAGGLHEGAVTNHPLSLGALSAMKVSFPDFYRDLQEDPAFLHRCTDVMVRKKPIEDQPLTTQQVLIEKYYKKRSGDASAVYELRPEHRPLRQFLASLVGIRWADSLQSILQLSEDPITRKLGAKAIPVYKSLVSGDTQGVLEGFGRHIDTKPLNHEQGLHLYRINENLRYETIARRTLAARVIADIVDRLPKNIANLLLGSLCRELEDSADLRSQLGIQKIKNILSVAPDDDQKAVASRLVEDVLTIDEDIRFRLESLEPPNIDEAVQFARDTVVLVLTIRPDYGLYYSSDQKLLDWLIERTVKINDKNNQLPFEELEQWMADHDDHLLDALSTRYTDLLADELSADSIPEIDEPRAMERVRKVFESLYHKGEESRPNLCNYLTRYVSLKLPEASQVAWELMTKHITMPNASQISEFITAFTKRLRLEEDSEKWELDTKLASKALIMIVRTRRADLDETALNSLSALSTLWSDDDTTASLSCEIISELMQVDTDGATTVLDKWTQNILGDLPIACVKFMASIFPDLQESTQSSVITHLQPIIVTDNISKKSAARYESFTQNIPDNAWAKSPLKEHLDGVLPQIAARHGNPNNYLFQVIPAVANLLHHASPNVLGPALHSLFEGAKGQPEIYSWLFMWMTANWPKPAKNLNPYNPAQIFLDGVDFVVAQPKIVDEGMLKSLCDMLEREIVPAKHSADLIRAACAIWTVRPDHAIETFKNGFNDLSPEQTANLVDHIQLDEDKQQTLLADAWSQIAVSQKFDDRIMTTIRLLEKGLFGTEEEPDRGLSLWFDAQNESRVDVLLEVIIQKDLNDSNRKRVWQQAISKEDNNLGPSFFIDALPKIVKLPSIDETAAAIFEDYDHVDKILSSTHNRTELSQRLMEAFSDAATMTIKSGIAEWCKRLSGQASLLKLNHEAITAEDLKILEGHFGRASEIKKLEKKINRQ